MELLMYISDFIVPAVILLVVAYGVSEKVKVYDEFVREIGRASCRERV